MKVGYHCPIRAPVCKIGQPASLNLFTMGFWVSWAPSGFVLNVLQFIYNLITKWYANYKQNIEPSFGLFGALDQGNAKKVF